LARAAACGRATSLALGRLPKSQRSAVFLVGVEANRELVNYDLLHVDYARYTFTMLCYTSDKFGYELAWQRVKDMSKPGTQKIAFREDILNAAIPHASMMFFGAVGLRRRPPGIG
jgi:hypothetical protein